MRYKITIISALLFSAMSPTQADIGIIGKTGTLGFGFEFVKSFNGAFNGRAGFNAFDYEFNQVDGDISYDYNLELNTVSALLDWHPFGGGFRLSAGAIVNGNQISGTATPNFDSFNIGGTTYTAEDVGRLDAKVDFNNVAPYFGIGWGNAAGKYSKGFSLSADLGVLFQGDPNVSLKASGTVATQPQFEDDIAREEQELQDELSGFTMYPVASIGISYAFH